MNLDSELLVWISHGLSRPWLDTLLIGISQRVTFAYPLLLGLLGLLIHRHGRDGAKLWFLLVFVVLLGDGLGNLLKHLTLQYRPCAEYFHALQPEVWTAWQCSNRPTGMPSNHALDFFAAVAFLALTTNHRVTTACLAIVAVLVAFSRVYLGKHFPSQVLVGATLGIAWGVLGGWLALHYLRFVQRARGVRDPHGQ